MDDSQKFLKALNLCYRLIAIRMRTEREIINYLDKKKKKYHFSQELIKKVVNELTQTSLIDDQEFVEWFVKSRVNRKPKSDWVLKMELAKYGINEDLINSYFEKNPVNNESLAYKVLLSKWDKWRFFSPEVRFKKAFGILQRRGFSYSVIKKTIANFEKKG